jgi:hexokinase
MTNSQDLLKREFIQLLSDTLALLGAEKRLVDEIKAMEETPFSVSMIDKIREYNREQSDRIKANAALLNTTFSYPAN